MHVSEPLFSAQYVFPQASFLGESSSSYEIAISAFVFACGLLFMVFARFFGKAHSLIAPLFLMKTEAGRSALLFRAGGVMFAAIGLGLLIYKLVDVI